MKKIFILTLLFVSATTVVAEAETKPAEIMPNFAHSLYLGITTNKSVVVAVGERGHVALSSDYGSTWQQAVNVPTRATLTAVSMSGQNIWAVGHDTTIIYSSDAGQNWQIQFADKDRQMPLLDVLFVNESDGYAIGAYGTYLTTNDGGKNWSDGLISEEQDFHLNKIIKVDDFKLFVVAEAGHAYRSFDVGNTWESIELPYPGSMFGVASYDNQIITYGLRGHVLVSNDFGETFTQLTSPIQDSLFGSAVTYSNKLLLVGANGAVLQYKNNTLTKINIPKSDGDFTGLLAIKDGKTIFISEIGISTKKIGN